MRRLSLILALTVAAPASAWAKPDKSNLKQADTLLREANAHYAAQRYDQAITAYSKAHALTDAAGFLYNIAQSYRLAGNCRKAIEYYEQFLADAPDTPIRAKVEGFVTEMWRCIDRQGKAEPRPDPSATGDGVIEKRVSADSGSDPLQDDRLSQRLRASQADSSQRTLEAERSGWAWTGLGISGLGVLAVGTGTYFGLQASKHQRELDFFEGEWTAREEGLQSQGQSAQRKGLIFGIVGGSAVIGGLLAFALAPTRYRTSTGLAVTPRAGGAQLGWSAQF